MAANATTIYCSQCDAPITIANPSRSQVVVCAKCAAVLDLTDDDRPVIGQRQPLPTFSLGLPLGRVGTLDGANYQIIGQVHYRDPQGYRWEEWLLLRDDGSECWLSSDPEQGIVLWTPFTPDPPLQAQSLHEGARITLFNRRMRVIERSSAQLEYFAGELPWKPQIGEVLYLVEAEHEGVFASIEWDDEGTRFFYGQRFSPQTIDLAFDVPREARGGSYPTGIGPMVSPQRSKKFGAGPLLVLMGVVVACMLMAFAALPGRRDCPPVAPVATVVGQVVQPTPVPQRGCSSGGSIRSGSPGRPIWGGGGK